ncbi:hypothetical protein HOD20_01070 [archaeon]|jgi:hypothetical protein|nr:hypothetical protein [archaeon]MBT4351094.1 hypothetical protein [archaeon]MBT4648098.1 hypothetical protein [archaeon]MBT6822536.1 hypothetical protein [archaeon]MBT7392537.1 hypothetical protein [archaeon]
MLGKKKKLPMKDIDEYMKNPSKKKFDKNYKKIIDTLYKELKRRDDIIDQLRMEKEILFKASIKSNERLSDIQKIKESKE